MSDRVDEVGKRIADSLKRPYILDPRRYEAIALAVLYGGIDGDHHKDWVIDQMVRRLAGDDYPKVVADACAGEDGPLTYEWAVGVAP